LPFLLPTSTPNLVPFDFVFRLPFFFLAKNSLSVQPTYPLSLESAAAEGEADDAQEEQQKQKNPLQI
jgi:hypothetical protein